MYTILRMFIIFILLNIFMPINSVGAILNEAKFENISIDEGLSNENVTSIFQDSRGYMWIGTKDGLNRYDGQIIKIYNCNAKNENTLSSTYIMDIEEDIYGNIWIDTDDGLDFLMADTGVIVRMKDRKDKYNLGELSITSLIKSKYDENIMWVGTENGLMKIDVRNNSIQAFYHDPNDLNSLTNSSITCLEEGENILWVGTKQGLNIIDKEDIKLDEPMKKHISFRVGGPADILVKPRTEEQIAKVVKLLKEENVPYIVIGNGSNLLVKDGGVRGVVIEISDNFNDFNIDGNIVNIQSGALLSFVGKAVLRAELKGFEFAAGIPGTLGGALAMNAGAYGGEMKDIVKSVRLMDTDGNILDFTNEQMEFSYRRSILSRTDYIVLSAQIELENGSYDEIKATMADFTQRRVTKQPLSLPSAGSTFKRPEGHFAAKLIDDSGLRGLTLRGAQVSEKHCGFVVNLGNAKAKDILDLMYIVKSTVKAKYGITLEEEVKILGED